ncbi:MAG TPA: PRC-barrel domain-containing protein [Solirubrobacteraceae bacterium]|nr:PRC-barrel domain-containing protein [Solirubrobacteraceae bacterium]
MIRASDLIGCVLRTEAGERLGRVHDLRAEATGEGWKLVGLVVGRGGMAARLIGSDPEPLVRGDTIPWQAVTGLKDGLVIVRDGTARR